MAKAKRISQVLCGKFKVFLKEFTGVWCYSGVFLLYSAVVQLSLCVYNPTLLDVLSI